jgi:hypothetical protein
MAVTRSTFVRVCSPILMSEAMTSFEPAIVITVRKVIPATPIPVRSALSRGRTSRWCSRSSRPIQRRSIHGQAKTTVNSRPGTTTPGRKIAGIVMPNIVHSHGGHSRMRPSSQPMYQSGCMGAKTSKGS